MLERVQRTRSGGVRRRPSELHHLGPARAVGRDEPVADLLASRDDTIFLSASEIGDWVVAVGNPMGLDHSASVGII